MALLQSRRSQSLQQSSSTSCTRKKKLKIIKLLSVCSFIALFVFSSMVTKTFELEKKMNVGIGNALEEFNDLIIADDMNSDDNGSSSNNNNNADARDDLNDEIEIVTRGSSFDDDGRAGRGKHGGTAEEEEKEEVMKLLRERALDRFGKETHEYFRARDFDFSSVVVAMDTVYGDKADVFDVKFTDVNGKKTHFLIGEQLGAVLEKEERLISRTHKSCALVGNSGTLLKSGFGDEIDEHEAVMRVNFAPVKNFRKDVGVKTTYDFSNRENARRLVEKGWENSRPESVALFFELSSPTNRKRIFEPLVKKYGKALKVQFLHPGFVNRAHDLWNVLKTIIEKEKKTSFHDKPMSGWYAVNFMMQRCESLDLYGFEPYTSKAKATAPYHYFDQVQGVVSVHSFDFAVFAYQKFAKVFPLRIRTSKGWMTT